MPTRPGEDTVFVALDWSGRASGAGESIWRAVATGGRLVELENGLEREAAIDHVIRLAATHPQMVVGLDFSFSFPGWFCAREGWADGPAVWRAMDERGEALLATCAEPFWGRPGRPAQQLGPALRLTEGRAGVAAKSTFQIGGAGAVGTGSVRGMPHLLRLARAGFAIWPFDEPAARTVVEIYPRLMTGGRRVVKRRHTERRTYLASFDGQDPVLLERAAGSEDAFDAAVSALTMAQHADEFAHLTQAAAGTPERIEGEIWRPRPR